MMPTIPMPMVRDVQFLHADPFGKGMLEALCADLEEALWIRFMVCYFNEDGYEALSPFLTGALRDPRSRGLFTLTCSCGKEAILKLTRDVKPTSNRLKVFLPLKDDAQSDVKLLHSKMALIVRHRKTSRGLFESPLEAILYVGSHNWTGPGLHAPSSNGPRNVESSLRVVADWSPNHERYWLSEIQSYSPFTLGNPILDALVQMHHCFNLQSCTDLSQVTAKNEMKDWTNANCTGESRPPGSTPFIVVTGVLAEEVDSDIAKSGLEPPPPRWPNPPQAGATLYIQHYNTTGTEPDVFDSSVTWAVLLWESKQSLINAEQPWLLLCRPSNLGQGRAGDPNLRQVDWVLYDPRQNVARGSFISPQEVKVSKLRSGPALKVEYWSVAPVAVGVPSESLNARTPDRYVLVDVVEVRSPRRLPINNAQWNGTELPFNQGKRRSRQRLYVVHDEFGMSSESRAMAMREEQGALLGVLFNDIDEELVRGPTGDTRLRGVDVYPCSAPINDLLFRTYDQDFVAIQDRKSTAIAINVDDDDDDDDMDDVDDKRPILFEVARARADVLERDRRVPRMERLFAPGVPYVIKALGLGHMVLQKLGLKNK